MPKSIYYRSPYIGILVNEVKNPLKQAIDVLTNPKSNIIQKAKAGKQILGVMQVIQDKLPEPTLENVQKPGTRILVRTRDEFFRRLHFPSVERYVRPMTKFVIAIYDTDLYDQYINWWVWEIKKSDWPPLRPFEPDPHWFNEK